VAVAILVAGFGSISFAQNLDESKWGKNTPGVELATHEGPRERTSSGTVLIYNILGKGFPADKKYDLWFWKLGQSPQNAIQGASFDKHGLLVCSGKPGFCKGAVADDAVNIKATATLGEPKRFAVISADGTVAGFADAVPFPLEASDKGCRLSVVREAADAAVVAVRVRGFAPNEPLIIKTNIRLPDSAHNPVSSSDGTWQATMQTKSAGQSSGIANIQVSGKACLVGLSFNWGEGSAKQQ
jgi:hypothetical protein